MKIINNFEPGNVVRLFDNSKTSVYRNGINLERQEIKEHIYSVPQSYSNSKNYLHAPDAPMIILIAKKEANSVVWFYKVLASNGAIGWTIVQNPKFRASLTYGLEKI